MLKMRRKQTAWRKEKPVKAAWWFGKPQRAFLFFLMSRKLLSTTMELFRVVWVFVRRAKNKMQGGGGGQHAKHLNRLCCMFFTVTSELRFITRLILNL